MLSKAILKNLNNILTTAMYIPRINWLFFLLLSPGLSYTQKKVSVSHNYYFSAAGNDRNDGSINHPFHSISLFNSLDLVAGDKIYFKGGEVFTGSLFVDSTKCGTSKKIIGISSYGVGKARINAGDLGA